MNHTTIWGSLLTIPKWNVYLIVWSPPVKTQIRVQRNPCVKAVDYFQWQRLSVCTVMMKFSDDCHVQLEFILVTNRGRSCTKTREKKKKKVRKQVWVCKFWWLPLRRTSPSAFPFHTRLSTFPPTIRCLPLIWNCFDIVKWNLCLLNTWANRCQAGANTQLDPPVPRELSHK